MSAAVLINGVIFREPERRLSKAGKPFVSATVKVRDGDGFQFWKMIVFSESIGEEIMRLSDGDAVSAQGTLRASTYEKAGQTHVGFSLIAAAVLPLRAARKSKPKCSPQERAPDRPAASKERPEPERLPLDRYGGCDGADPALDDELPF